MENRDFTEKNVACKSLKVRLLRSLGNDLTPLLTEALKYSVHPTLEDAALELSRSELVFVALLQALTSKNLVMSGRLLLEAQGWELLPRISAYMGGKLRTEFNCTNEFVGGAAAFAHTLQDSGLMKVPKKYLKYLDYLAKNVREEIEAREMSSRQLGVLKESASTPSPATTSMANEDQIAPTTSNPPTQSAVASISRPQIAQTSAAPPMQSAVASNFFQPQVFQTSAGIAFKSAAAPPMQSDSAPPMQSDSAPPMQSAIASTVFQPQVLQTSAGIFINSAAALPMQSAAAPPMQSAAAPPMQSAAAGAPPMQSDAAPPMQSAAAPPMQSAAAPPMQSAPAPPMQTAAPPMQSAAAPAPPMQSAAAPPMQSAAASTSYLSEAGTSGGSQEAGGQENQGAISRRAISRGQKRRRTSDTQVKPIIIVEPQTHDQVLRENATLALFAAVQNNDPEATRDTIVNGACIDRRNANGFTPLHVAAGMGHLKAMAVLLKRGADTEVVDSAGDRPLHTAAANGMDKAVALLLVAGADINARDQGGLTPVLRAAGRGSTTDLLRPPAYSLRRRGRSASYVATEMLMYAVRRNDPQAVRAAIENGADIEERRDSDGTTALHVAAALYDNAMAVLLRAGADMEAVASANDRPLHWAAGWGRDGAVALLAVAGADLLCRGWQGMTPLEQAAHRGHTSTVALLRSLIG